jgi:hypothetical protein
VDVEVVDAALNAPARSAAVVTTINTTAGRRLITAIYLRRIVHRSLSSLSRKKRPLRRATRLVRLFLAVVCFPRPVAAG